MNQRDCYIPGNTNIGKKEKSRRTRNGWIYLFVAISAFVIMVLLDLPRIYRFLIYIPATLSALGFLQAGSSFCVYYGLKGEYHLDSGSEKVSDTGHQVLDKKASMNILIVALSVGFAATVLAYLFF